MAIVGSIDRKYQVFFQVNVLDRFHFDIVDLPSLYNTMLTLASIAVILIYRMSLGQ